MVTCSPRRNSAKGLPSSSSRWLHWNPISARSRVMARTPLALSGVASALSRIVGDSCPTAVPQPANDHMTHVVARMRIITMIFSLSFGKDWSFDA